VTSSSCWRTISSSPRSVSSSPRSVTASVTATEGASRGVPEEPVFISEDSNSPSFCSPRRSTKRSCRREWRILLPAHRCQRPKQEQAETIPEKQDQPSEQPRDPIESRRPAFIDVPFPAEFDRNRLDSESFSNVGDIEWFFEGARISKNSCDTGVGSRVYQNTPSKDISDASRCLFHACKTEDVLQFSAFQQHKTSKRLTIRLVALSFS